MASGALPPAFPSVRVDGELYWDGGILSNTPTEVVFDDNPRRDALIFTVHLWNPLGAEPTTMADVLNRHKDVQYSSRIASQIARHQQTPADASRRIGCVTSSTSSRCDCLKASSASLRSGNC
jgi:NTE family protein